MNTLFDKIWDRHVVQKINDGPTQLYIDRLYCHEVTSPQAFADMRAAALNVSARTHRVHAGPQHADSRPGQAHCRPRIPKPGGHAGPHARDFGLTHFGMMDPRNGIIHVVGPERGLTLPGMTIVCGDSHTSTHGAMVQ